MWRLVALAAGLVLAGWYTLTRASARRAEDGPLFLSLGGPLDYADRYSTSIPPGVTIDDVAATALQRGTELGRSATEVVFQDGAPGLRFLVSYHLSSDGTLSFSTGVTYEGSLGHWYFTAIKPFHRMLAPAVPIITVQRARNHVQPGTPRGNSRS